MWERITVTEELRALLNADLAAHLAAERPPPIGDVVAAAMRSGRRQRRNRRLAAAGAGATLAGAVAVALVSGTGFATRLGAAVPAAGVPSGSQAPSVQLPASPAPPPSVALPVPPVATDEPWTLSPGSVPTTPADPSASPRPRRLTIHSGTQRAEATQKKATTAAMLHLLTQLLPPGRTSHHGTVSGDDLHVQVYLDRGAGPGMVRVAVAKSAPGGQLKPRTGLPRGGAATVTVDSSADDCVRSTTVAAQWADGTTVRVDVAGCLVRDGRRNPPARPVLTADDALRIVADTRWGVTMPATEVELGAQRFGSVPVFAR